jgi:drug/metabolite transporter superfamily protein YnfA
MLFAYLLTLVDTAAAGRAYAAYGGGLACRRVPNRPVFIV